MSERRGGVRDPYRTVLEVGTTLASTLELEEVAQTIARQVGEALDVQWCDINEYDPEARTMTYVAVWSKELRDKDTAYIGTVVSLDDRPERDAVIRKGDLLEQYVDDEDLDTREREVMLEYDERAVMEVPLEFGGETLGVLGVVESRRERRFTEDEKQLLRLLARPAATALGNARLFRQQQEQARRLTTLLNATRTLAMSVDLDEVLADVARLAAESVHASYANVYEYRPHHDAIVYRAEHLTGAAADEQGGELIGAMYALAEFPDERAILEAPRAVQEHISDADLPEDRRSSMQEWDQKTCLSLPLRAGGEARGILRITSTDRERRFTADELELVSALAESASTAIHNARMFRIQERESEQLLRLFEVSRRFTSVFDRPAVMAALEEGAQSLLPDGVTVCVWALGHDGRLVPVSRGAVGDERGAELARQSLASRRLVERVDAGGSWFAAPLAVKDRAEGAVVVEAQGYLRLSSAEREALQVLANQAAAALENERLYRRAEQEAIRDGLTGLYNHRHFQERLRQEHRRSCRYGTPLSLLMLDLDGFKAFNDQFGHQIGDEALREVGQILFAVTRRGIDLAARYGGEEFAVILPHTQITKSSASPPPAGPPPAGAGALVVAERIRAAIAGHAFPGHGGRRSARITVTIGVGELLAQDDPDTLIAATDAALYEGKRSGRDRVVLRAL